MKPVLKKETTYSVLFMRDDCGVLRFRLQAFWLKFFCVFVALLVLVTAAGGWAAYYYWKKHSALSQEHRELQRDMAESRVQLERLANLEKFLQARESAPATVNMDAANATAPVQAALFAVANASSSAAQEAQEAPAQESPIKLGNSNVRISGATRLRIGFDLVNQNPQLPLTGRVNLAVITAAGTTVDVAGPDEELRFSRIARYKRISASIPLPPDTPSSSVKAVQVSIDAEGVPPFVEQISVP